MGRAWRGGLVLPWHRYSNTGGNFHMRFYNFRGSWVTFSFPSFVRNPVSLLTHLLRTSCWTSVCAGCNLEKTVLSQKPLRQKKVILTVSATGNIRMLTLWLEVLLLKPLWRVRLWLSVRPLRQRRVSLSTRQDVWAGPRPGLIDGDLRMHPEAAI